MRGHLSNSWALVSADSVCTSALERSLTENTRFKLAIAHKTHHCRDVELRLTITPVLYGVCVYGGLRLADRMMWPPSLSRDRKWPRVTKCTHLRVVGLRWEGNLVCHFLSQDSPSVVLMQTSVNINGRFNDKRNIKWLDLFRQRARVFVSFQCFFQFKI